MNIIKELETITMNLTGCDRAIANTVVNAIINTWDKNEELNKQLQAEKE